jgi:HlyD family secretion protein
LAQAKLLAARQEWERIKDGPDPDDITAAEVRLASVRATLDLARIDAPFAGTVTEVESQVGDLVNAGTAAFRVDDLSRLLVKVQVSEVDINRVEVGQGVVLTFDAILEKEYAGVVTDIASSGSSAGGAVNFTVTVELANPDEDIRPGMTAAANIAVSQLDDVLLVPSRAVRTVGGSRVVYVLRNNVPMMVEVELGASSNAQVQITSGDVKEGDRVILNPPSNLMLGPGMGVGRTVNGGGGNNGGE